MPSLAFPVDFWTPISYIHREPDVGQAITALTEGN